MSAGARADRQAVADSGTLARMRRRLALLVLAFVMFVVGCAAEQPWPMGYWEGESTLVHLDTMAVTISPLQGTMAYPGFDGVGVDDPRFGLGLTLSARSINGSGAPGSTSGTRVSTVIDRGAYAGLALMTRTGPSTTSMQISWRDPQPDAGFLRFDPTAPVVYSERAALRRVRDYELPPPF